MTVRPRLVFLAIALSFGIQNTPGQSPASADSSIDPLELRLRAAELELNAPANILHQSYRANLEKLSATTSALKSPHRAALIQEEIAGFAYDRIAPSDDFPELRRLQEIFDKEIAKLELQRTRNLKTLFQRYRIDYREIESSLDRQGRPLAAAAAKKNAAKLSARLEDIGKQLDSTDLKPSLRVSTRSYPIAVFTTNGQPIGTSEWKDGLSKDWALTGPAQGPADYWELQLAGRLRVPAQGTYTLTGTADDRVLLTIDDKTLTEIAIEKPTEQALGSVELSRGWHPFTLVFTEGVSYASFDLQWSGPGFAARPIGPLELSGKDRATGK